MKTDLYQSSNTSNQSIIHLDHHIYYTNVMASTTLRYVPQGPDISLSSDAPG